MIPLPKALEFLGVVFSEKSKCHFDYSFQKIKNL